jgi:ribosomal protein S18 acetylase RimI-like enzyme
MIESLGSEHVNEVAALHCATLTGLLSQLGKPAVEAFYKGCVKINLAIGLVYLEEGKARGFVLGSPHPDQLKGEVLRKNPFGTLASLFTGAIARPSSMMWLLKSFRGPDEGSFDTHAPELIYLAVSPDQRGGGVGSKLVKAFNERMRATGVDAYDLSVDEDNITAIAFYERLGFQRTGTYREFGTSHRRYRLVIR